MERGKEGAGGRKVVTNYHPTDLRYVRLELLSHARS